MAETMNTTLSFKRLREEDEVQQFEDSKRPKSSSSSYNQILSFLEEDEDEPNQDLSSLITSLQEEISSNPRETELPSPTEPKKDSSSSSSSDEEEKEGVIRHLLEASDDELGIPNSDILQENYEVFNGGTGENGFEFSLCDGLWEFEDETANYYTLLQSELFL